MSKSKKTFLLYLARLMFWILWVICLGIFIYHAPKDPVTCFAAAFMFVVFVVCLKTYWVDFRSLNRLCDFYELAYSFDGLQLLKKERPYKKILDTVLELGDYDWAVLFMMDFEKDTFNAVESSGISIDKIASTSFEELIANKDREGWVSLSVKLLDRAFLSNELKGAVAGASIERDDSYYGCLLVGRDDAEVELSSDDTMRLNILTDQIAVCLHNYQMHNELSFRAEELGKRQAQIRRELDMARIVQDGVIRDTADYDGVKIASFLKPARFIGGDFLRCINDKKRKSLQILIGDVCGKGIPAALVMSVVICMFKEKRQTVDDLAELMSQINVSLKQFLGAGSRFNSSAMFAVYDGKTRNLTYASAGHDFPLLYSAADKKIYPLESTGTLLGIFVESQFTSKTIKLAKGDRIIFYSDGLIDFFEYELQVPDGFEHLQEFFSERNQTSADEIISELRSMIENKEDDLKDDVSVVVFSVED